MDRIYDMDAAADALEEIASKWIDNPFSKLHLVEITNAELTDIIEQAENWAHMYEPEHIQVLFNSEMQVRSKTNIYTKLHKGYMGCVHTEGNTNYLENSTIYPFSPPDTVIRTYVGVDSGGGDSEGGVSYASDIDKAAVEEAVVMCHGGDVREMVVAAEDCRREKKGKGDLPVLGRPHQPIDGLASIHVSTEGGSEREREAYLGQQGWTMRGWATATSRLRHVVSILANQAGIHN
ncbi:hypothetical protein CPB84DRAFT_1746453 [Gymnopilus junonius]|uniref:Uncharacterized protein n=1 Tax=Gymnopilus junonius TaxID=109634 RepID=A0A9P5NSH5_GYMJU|nr:hypothetical protein CPB84DRAFT_1746453 [Gymnopilus junonius]